MDKFIYVYYRTNNLNYKNDNNNDYDHSYYFNPFLPNVPF